MGASSLKKSLRAAWLCACGALVVSLVLLGGLFVMEKRQRALEDSLKGTLKELSGNLDESLGALPDKQMYAEIVKESVEDLLPEESGGSFDSMEMKRLLKKLEIRQNSFEQKNAAIMQEFSRSIDSRLGKLEAQISHQSHLIDTLASDYALFAAKKEEEGDYNQAAEYYRNSLEYDKSSQVMIDYARSLYKAEPAVRNDDEIISTLKAVLREERYNEEALELLGAVYLEAGLQEESKGVLGKLAELHPEDKTIQARYGRILFSLGDYESAVDALEAARGSGSEEAFLLGRSYMELELYREAAAAFEDSLRIDMLYGPSLLALSQCYVELGN